MLLRAFWQETRSSAGSGLAGGGGLGEVWRAVELNRVPRFIHGRGRHSIPGASSPLAELLVASPRGGIARYLAPSCRWPFAGGYPLDRPGSLGSKVLGYVLVVPCFSPPAKIEGPGQEYEGSCLPVPCPCHGLAQLQMAEAS